MNGTLEYDLEYDHAVSERRASRPFRRAARLPRFETVSRLPRIHIMLGDRPVELSSTTKQRVALGNGHYVRRLMARRS
jgi:ABC-type molybdate transport system ATPase subunit